MKLRDAKLKSSWPEVFYKKDVSRIFAKFTGKHLCQRLFLNKVAGNFKNSLWHRCFPVNTCEFLRTPFSTEPLWATVSAFNGHQALKVQFWDLSSIELNSVRNFGKR